MRTLKLASILLIVLVVGYIIARFISAAVTADRMERRLHAVLCVSDVISSFLEKHGRLPESWEDLEDFTPDSKPRGFYEWPKEADVVRNLVEVNFRTTASNLRPENVCRYVQSKGRTYGYCDRLWKLEQAVERHRLKSEVQKSGREEPKRRAEKGT